MNKTICYLMYVKFNRNGNSNLSSSKKKFEVSSMRVMHNIRMSTNKYKNKWKNSMKLK